jgi:hypothetical protein
MYNYEEFGMLLLLVVVVLVVAAIGTTVFVMYLLTLQKAISWCRRRNCRIHLLDSVLGKNFRIIEPNPISPDDQKSHSVLTCIFDEIA